MKDLRMENFGFSPVKTLDEFNSIDDADAVNGYRAGLKGREFEYNKSRSYYHGYLNGLNDGGFRVADNDQLEMVKLIKNETDYIEKVQELAKIFISELNGKTIVH